LPDAGRDSTATLMAASADGFDRLDVRLVKLERSKSAITRNPKPAQTISTGMVI
jgi:hypothetical protein